MRNHGFKPMLAGTVQFVSELQLPMWASPKLDGIRAVIIDGVVMSRNLKPIPNKHVQKLFGKQKFNGLDGELLLHGVDMKDVFRHTSSAVMSVDGEPEVWFHVFDTFLHGGGKYSERLDVVDRLTLGHDKVTTVSCIEIYSEEDLELHENLWLGLGYEGVMLRKDEGYYKFGRSTLKEALLLKLKRFCDSEAEIIGVEEQMENTNEKTTDALGRSKRSSHKAGKVAKNLLGAVEVKDLKTGVEFNIGSGFSLDERAQFWADHTGRAVTYEAVDEHGSRVEITKYPTKCGMVGRIVKYRYFPTGSKDKPRFPTFVGFRDVIDI